jgi:hypothetical protein
MSAGSSSLFGFDDGAGGDGEDRVTLTAKPHAFAGAVLCPKHARELTPSLCLAVASALAEQSHLKPTIPYTLWITEAWRILGTIVMMIFGAGKQRREVGSAVRVRLGIDFGG